MEQEHIGLNKVLRFSLNKFLQHDRIVLRWVQTTLASTCFCRSSSNKSIYVLIIHAQILLQASMRYSPYSCRESFLKKDSSVCMSTQAFVRNDITHIDPRNDLLNVLKSNCVNLNLNYFGTSVFNRKLILN